MWSVLFRSFYSASAYREVARWRGKAILYLAFVLALCWIPTAVRLHVLFVRGFELMVQAVVPQIPKITFSKGQITTPENRPYFIRFGEGDKKVEGIVDTSGKYTTLDGQTAQVLLTRDKLISRRQNGEIRVYDLSGSKAGPIVVDQTYIDRFVNLLRRWAILVMSPFFYVFSLLKRMVQAFFIALLGLALVSILEAELDLGELFSLAIVAMTPAMVLQTVWFFTDFKWPWIWLVWAGLILAHFIFAINAAATKILPSETE